MRSGSGKRRPQTKFPRGFAQSKAARESYKILNKEKGLCVFRDALPVRTVPLCAADFWLQARPIRTAPLKARPIRIKPKAASDLSPAFGGDKVCRSKEEYRSREHDRHDRDRHIRPEKV